ncbi:TIGR01212 family radical SAM protein [Pseudodesulfovibrio sp. F-1]|uniref:TIGR01212 family radical SAM protein n=1 Tax=Pseudodesulfovibrio alkaliphilus TaxID=2661613 RepID=A0A7K1KMX4_9BACT|nr:TIGR01212 family radical SAM protein [Pseudodesulfovibrio alkaliphilus]MUM77433.1 TIGR01212 family radical SAM protein [Pseudodesulfovibrio alkaliphilus]
MKRFHALSTHLRQLFGGRVLKIPLDAGFSCPNRDGTLSVDGCVFCNPSGSGSGLLSQGLDIPAQWAFWRSVHARRGGVERYTAYLQSFSNTHGPVSRLARTLDALAGLPGLVALSIGTRPDCLDSDKLDLLAERRKALGLADLTLELGLQSADDATLAHVGRGHDAAAFADAARAAAGRGLTVVAHVMAGLPTPGGREGRGHLAATVDFVNALPVQGIKFHNVYVARGTRLARLHAQGEYEPLTRDEYLEQLGHALERLAPTTVVHRLNANPAQGELLAPAWAGNMRALHNAVRAHLDAADIRQGRLWGPAAGASAWFSTESKGELP